MRRIAILGSTGSIGTQTLDVIANHPELFEVTGLAAGTNMVLVKEQIRAFRPKIVSVLNKQLAEELRLEAFPGTRIVYGDEGVIEIATDDRADVVVTAMVGSVGLRPTLAAIEAGKQIALANKETLITAGHIVTELAAKHGVSLLPVDSEHSAIFQCLNGESLDTIDKITITASGGSFRHLNRDELKHVTVEQALKHPNWSMGAKITIDSATMVNKGLEVMEAHWLFQLDYDQIDVLLHAESVIHSMVHFKDHSVIAQLGTPDMRVPIQYALTYPKRISTNSSKLNLAEFGKLHFSEMDYDRFPLLRLAYECGRSGGTAPTVYNAANEKAVEYFLKGGIPFLEIESIIARAVDAHEMIARPELLEIENADRWTRELVEQWIHP